MAELFEITSPAAVPAPALADAEARARALDIHRSAIVEAPAGSGKTGLLMQRFLKLLADDQVMQPEEILAVTFTNKAAAEMRERVLEQLHAARDARPFDTANAFQQQTRSFALAVLARDAALDWRILDRPQRLNLRTIDSISSEIANALPLVSGAGAPRTPAADARPLYRQAARRTLEQLGGSDRALSDALRSVLLHRDANLKNCETLLADMLARREQWGELVPLTPGELDGDALDRTVRPRLERLLESIVCEGLSRAARLLPAGVLAELSHIAAAFGELPGYNRDNPFALCAQRNQPPEAVAEHLDHWTALITLLLKPSDGDWRKSFAKNHLHVEPDKLALKRLKELVESIQHDDLRDALAAVLKLPPARYPDEQWAVARALFYVLRHALAELRLLFAERGECDFSELALSAREALRSEDSASDVALAYGGRLRHLLVDEMQDTSAGQYELISLLTRSFDGHGQTLFLVGDPKQSIYLFRQARVERFLHTLDTGSLGDIPLDVLRLTSNFRSQGELVEQFNDTFEPLFARFEPGVKPPAGEIVFVAATPVREPSPFAVSIAWHPSILPSKAEAAEQDTGDDVPDVRAQQAMELRRVVDHWRSLRLPAGRSKPWRIAVLASARTQLHPVIAEFKRDRGHGTVPFRAVDIDPLGKRPEVLEALALTRALLHPADRVAWLAVLRAPWCGLTMADLLALTGEGIDSSSRELSEATVPWLIEHRAQHLSPEGQSLLQRAWIVLDAARNAVGAAPLAVQVERTWRSLGGDLPLDSTARDNVRRYFELLARLAADGGPLDPQLLAAQLNDLYAEPAEAAGAVELMTMHKAKGLEWDVVLVPSLERKPATSGEPLLNWIELESGEHESSSMLLAPIVGSGEQNSKLNDWLKDARRRREFAERRRLFYVACTRAREELHLFAAVQRKKDGSLSQPTYGSLLQACWPAAEPFFQQELNAPAAALQHGLAQSLALDDDASPNGFEDDAHSGLALAASAAAPATPILTRLPASLNLAQRFTDAALHSLPYPPASALPAAPAFDRPEGSFAVRAFGNVVHRYLQHIAEQLDAGIAIDALAAQLASWDNRLAASLRSEGLAPAQAQRDAARAREALERTMADPIGRWILSPHSLAASEQEFAFADSTTATRTLRADRIFTTSIAPPLAAPATQPLPSGAVTWIIDFKTADQGSRSDALFEAQQRDRYSDQLDAYAGSLQSLQPHPRPILLGLYYPVSQKLLWWAAPAPEASKTQ